MEGSEEFFDVTINIRELDDVLMKDVGNKIAESGKYVFGLCVRMYIRVCQSCDYIYISQGTVVPCI